MSGDKPTTRPPPAGPEPPAGARTGVEFPVLTAVLHCVHAFLVAKVASLDPGFAGSPSLSRKPLGAADALCQGRELNYFLKRRTFAASIALCGFKRAYGVTPSSPSRLQPWASLLEDRPTGRRRGRGWDPACESPHPCAPRALRRVSPTHLVPHWPHPSFLPRSDGGPSTPFPSPWRGSASWCEGSPPLCPGGGGARGELGYEQQDYGDGSQFSYQT
ncbi:gamma-2-syntrophin [Eptesicus fuscus]|uniref:gamma-2-syntrophin n=1 Tax=Eptesicus fuscus TaxID=29078 RepID=UPI002403FB2A|nr:gamma-2-syntrophin [Eptesicus fuscus]